MVGMAGAFTQARDGTTGGQVVRWGPKIWGASSKSRDKSGARCISVSSVVEF